MLSILGILYREDSLCVVVYVYKGVRGELYVEVKLDMIQDQQRFKQSSFGVQFYSCKLAGVRLKGAGGLAPFINSRPLLGV